MEIVKKKNAHLLNMYFLWLQFKYAFKLEKDFKDFSSIDISHDNLILQHSSFKLGKYQHLDLPTYNRPSHKISTNIVKDFSKV